MYTIIVDSLDTFRRGVRQLSMLSAVASAAALVLIPLAYRGTAPTRWLVVVLSASYLLASLFRLLSLFQVDRQVEVENRFMTFAASHRRLLETAVDAGKILRYSCIVQGLRRAATRLMTDHEADAAIRQSLFSASRILVPSRALLAIPLLALVVIAWTHLAATNPEVRGFALFLVVLPLLMALAMVEIVLVLRRRRSMQQLHDLIDALGDRARVEWSDFDRGHFDRPFRHRLFYRDPLRTP